MSDNEILITDNMRKDLARVVSGLTTFVLEFDGPNTAYIGTDPIHEYVALCSHGVKLAGEQPLSFGWQEAIELYGDELRVMAKDNAGKMLAWRHRPSLECEGPAKYHVYSRLVFI